MSGGLKRKLPPIRAVAALWLCKLLQKAIRLLGRGGTNRPGEIALKVCPDLLRYLSSGIRVIIVSGTNGKTTTCRLIEQGIKDSGLSFFANRSGANLLAGIVTEFSAHARWNCRPRTDAAVIECDEAALKYVLSYLSAEVILFTNVFRDQLDRYGEVAHTLENLRLGAEKNPTAKLCLNADDSLIASLHQKLPNSCIFYGIDCEPGDVQTDILSDAMYCIRCKHRYSYSYRTYGHLGGFSCPNCGYSRYDVQVSVASIKEQTLTHSIIDMVLDGNHREMTVPLPAIYNVYNFLAAVTALHAFGIQVTSLDQVSAFGRLERFPLGNGVTMILVKNPAGFAQVITYLCHMEKEYDLVCCLNDRPADGTDISWIWDVPVQHLLAQNGLIQRIYFCGTRKEEMCLRFKYAGFDPSKLELVSDEITFFQGIKAHPRPVVIVPTYTAMLQVRQQLAKLSGRKSFWE